MTISQLFFYCGLSNICTSISYLKENPEKLLEKPYFFVGPLDPDQKSLRTNLSFRFYSDIPVYDLRFRIQELSIERHGFEIVKHLSPNANILHDDTAKEKYLKKIIQLLKTKLHTEMMITYEIRVNKKKAFDLLTHLFFFF